MKVKKGCVTVWVVHDTEEGGWACDDVMEGLIFTRLRSYAKEFGSEAEAKATIREHYSDMAERCRVVKEEVQRVL